MARLLEYQAKAVLRGSGIATPRGVAAGSRDAAREAAASLGGATVVKVQTASTGRKAAGGVAFAKDADEAGQLAEKMLAMQFGKFPVELVLVEEKLAIARELFVSLAIDDKAKAPVLLISAVGGSGIEERAGDVLRVACTVEDGPDMSAVASFVAGLGLTPATQAQVVDVVRKVFEAARANEARSVEINPLAVLADGRVVALDGRVTIDDYAVFRHPDLGIEIARELDHPPTALERTAYKVEQDDHRGTFFFAQMNTEAAAGSKGLVGFHGAGGGGSMMSMDAITNVGFTIANFTDTSGNPSAAKVYRAARIILTQPGLCGYFGSGSGVASQEQFWSAYGLAKAFWELELNIPAVVRLGGNTEDRAVEILQSVNGQISATVEGYKKSDPPAKIAARFAELVAGSGGAVWQPRAPRRPRFVGEKGSHSFSVKGGTVWIDAGAWKRHAAAIVARSGGLLKDAGGMPAITVTTQELMAKDSEMIACEVECRRDGVEGFFVVLDVAGVAGV
ncbi:MAG TPA: ATP-grasp domain-containing protein [Phycisphaerales bacterium]|nr:ATP-grasp domain-containing protein [Phycisphaerales bacterium]